MVIHSPRDAAVALGNALWSEARIAAACGTSQSTIHRIKRGTQKTVSFEVGTALVFLAQQQGITVATTTLDVPLSVLPRSLAVTSHAGTNR